MINPGVRDQFQALTRHPAFHELVRRLAHEPSTRSTLGGLTPTAKALYLTLLWENLEQPILVVTDTNRTAEILQELLETFHGLLLAGRNAAASGSYSRAGCAAGAGSLAASGDQGAAGGGFVPSGDGEVLHCSDAGGFGAAAHGRCGCLPATGFDATPGRRDRDGRPGASHLDSIGYEKREPVEMEGEYSIRGGIFDVFPAEAHRPIRIEFFGDTVESLRRFDPETQRSVLKVEEVTLLPMEETPRTRDFLRRLSEVMQADDVVPGETFPGWEFAAPLLRPRNDSIENLIEKPILVWDEPELLKAASERLWKQLDGLTEQAPCPPEQVFRHWGEFQAQHTDRREIELRYLALEGETHSSEAPLEIRSRPGMAFRNNMPAAVSEARSLVDKGFRVAFFAAAQGEVERLADILGEYSLPFQLGMELTGSTPQFLADRAYMAMQTASVYLIQGQVRRGVTLPEAQFALIGSEDLFEASDYAAQPARARSHVALFTPESLDLKIGDYVVHAQHGIGRFTGLRQISGGDTMEDFMVVEYAAESKLYVPLTRLDLIQKYRGSNEGKPALDKLGGVTWAKTKSRVKAKMRDMAEELLKLYAERKMSDGYAFSADSNWQREFEDAFEYSATRDQLQAVTEIKRDMESPHPMDRLLCGDVGFGKTEVAMRAAFKALGDGKQVAVLAPTTVLALQHFETFQKRFQAFPVRIEMLSRFRSPKETKAVLADLKAGKVDVVVGTHQIMSKDLEFPDLGLLVVDEEQRFGVAHKERLKQLKKSVDVLTMSATPIPRTLHMSLLGLRDMSVIETPPKDRLAVQTVVAKFNPDLIKTAIEQELQRGGQVYFVHNRVDSIWTRAAAIQELVPSARVTVGHGQMGETELEKVLLSFMHRGADVFVCTTIVENGLDIPLANTIIIENAQNYGLSELYQLRGRVGQKQPAGLRLPDGADRCGLDRGGAEAAGGVEGVSDLGAGFKIAALDLELRGAGNLLGGEQHGHLGGSGLRDIRQVAGRDRAGAAGRDGGSGGALLVESWLGYPDSA
ncbi:MAG: transcription-repair coupling factor [Paludibaculum sp.]